MSTEYLQGFYLSDLFVEPPKGQVTGKIGTSHLPPKAMEVLLCLARTPGELVTRDTLLEEVWGRGQGSAEALSHAVSEVRHALDDHAEDPHYIQTLPNLPLRAGTFVTILVIAGFPIALALSWFLEFRDGQAL